MHIHACSLNAHARSRANIGVETASWLASRRAVPRRRIAKAIARRKREGGRERRKVYGGDEFTSLRPWFLQRIPREIDIGCHRRRKSPGFRKSPTGFPAFQVSTFQPKTVPPSVLALAPGCLLFHEISLSLSLSLFARRLRRRLINVLFFLLHVHAPRWADIPCQPRILSIAV